MFETPNDDLKKLEKIKKKMMESEELNVESYRRFQVAQEKLAGWLIEWVQSQRHKMKEKGRLALLSGILQRTTDLRNHVLLEYLSNMEHGKYELHLSEEQQIRLKPTVMKMVELYRNIRIDLTELFKDDPMSRNLPHVPRRIISLDFKLKELNMCLGQITGYVFGKIFELAS